MKRWLPLLALLLMLPACGDPLENGAFLDRPRVLGVKVEIDGDPGRAAPAPGETAALRWLVASPEDFEWSGAVTACISAPNQTGIPGCAGEPFGVLPTGMPSREPVVTMTLPDAAAFEGTPGELLVVGVLCANGTPTLDGCSEGAAQQETVLFTMPVSLGLLPANRHPSIAEETFTYEDEPWDPPPADLPATGCASTTPSAAFPHVPWRAEEDWPRITMTTQADDREMYMELIFGSDMPMLVESREELRIAHIATAGRMGRTQTPVYSDESMQMLVPWEQPPAEEVPADGLTVEMIFVARDRRGGMDWAYRAVCLVP